MVADVLELIRFACSFSLLRTDRHDGVGHRDGILAAFDEYNRRPKKRFRLELVAQDDAGDPTTTLANVQQFVQDSTILGILGMDGTFNTELAARIALAKGMPVVAQYGGISLRYPFQQGMIFLRASYYDEAAALVEHLLNDQKRSRIGVLVQNSTFGNVTMDGILAALDSNNLHLHTQAFISEAGNTSSWANEINAAIEVLATSSDADDAGELPDGIIVATDNEPASLFLALGRRKFPDAILAYFSTVSVADLMRHLGDTLTNPSAMDGVIISQIVPLATDIGIRVVREFQTAMSGINQFEYTQAGMEGFLMGKLVIKALEQISDENFTSEAFSKAIYDTSYFNLNGLRVGPFINQAQEERLLGRPLQSCNQGMHEVYMTTILPNKTLAWIETFPFETCGYESLKWQTLRFGQSCSYSGPLSSLCGAFRDGLLAAFKELNLAGGIRGSVRLQLVTLEDFGDPATALANNLELLNDAEVFGLIGTSSVGIEQLIDVMGHRTEDFIFGAFDGDIQLREPFRRNVVNFRAGVVDEIYALVHHCYYLLRVTRVSVLYESTRFGEERRDKVAEALDEKRLHIFTQAAFTADNVTEAVARVFSGSGDNLEAVVFIGLDDVFGTVAATVHAKNRNVMVFGLSKTITTQLLLPENHELVNWDKLLLVTCVPDATNQTIEVVDQYTTALMELDSKISPSPAGLEGYVVGQLLAIALNSIMGKDITVANLLDAIYDHGIFKVADLRCGPFLDGGNWGSISAASSSASSCNQCMRQVYLVGFNTHEGHAIEPFAFDTCMYLPTVNLDFDLQGSRLVFVLLADLGVLFSLVIMVLLIRFRHTPQVRRLSIRFAVVSCVGAMLCFGGVMVLYPIPNDLTCALGPWVSDLAFVTLFGPIFAKTYRIDKLINGKKLKRQVINDWQVLQVFGAVWVVFVVFLMVRTVVDAPRMTEAFTVDHVRYETCSSKYATFDQIDYILKALVLVWGCVLCQRVYKISGQFARFNESKELVVCIYHTTFLALCVLLIGMTTRDHPNLQYACVAGLVIENTLLVVTLLYGRPLFHAILKHADTTEESDGSTDNDSTAHPAVAGGASRATSASVRGSCTAAMSTGSSSLKLNHTRNSISRKQADAKIAPAHDQIHKTSEFDSLHNDHPTHGALATASQALPAHISSAYHGDPPTEAWRRRESRAALSELGSKKETPPQDQSSS